jgi:hypothetical protein
MVVHRAGGRGRRHLNTLTQFRDIQLPIPAVAGSHTISETVLHVTRQVLDWLRGI